MSKLNKRKKVTAVLASTAVLVGGAGVAYAYWTTSGSGTGSAATSAGDSDLTITQTSTIQDLAPGAPAQDIKGTVTNNAPNDAYVNTVTVSVADTSDPDCDASDFTISNGGVMDVQTDLAANGGDFDFSGVTIQFNNKPNADQDACKGATVNLAYASN